MAKGHPFHPGRKEHAEQFIESLADPKSRAYAAKRLDYIWQGRGKQPRKPSGLKAGRIKEVDAALYAIFATLR